MALERFLIAPFKTGLQTDLRPWLIMDDAMEELVNAYVFRGRIRKRFGGRLMGTSSDPLTAPLLSRLRVNIGTTDGSGNLAFTALPGTILNPGSMFSAGGIIFTVTTVPGVVGNDATLSTDAGPGGPAVGTVRLDSTGPNVYQFRITGGQVSIATTIVWWYPALPVMGLSIYDKANTAINDQPPYAFDTQFAYTYSGGWLRSPGSIPFPSPVWHGNNSNFFWTHNWVGATDDARLLFVTNFNATVGTPGANDDPLYYFDGTNWVNFSPFTVFLSDGSYVQTARIIVAFKNVLILLNTVERNAPSGTNTNAAFPQRARYSIRGSPIAQTVVGADKASFAWLEPNQTFTVGAAVGKAAGAGYLDASTDEQIVSAEFIKDRLIVFFERSTWELVWTGNYATPFYWQRLNAELGCEAQNSAVPFDKFVLAIGNTGVHSCNGANVERIDNKIPDQIFEVRTQDGANQRICGIRDYFAEMVYWTYVSQDLLPSQTYPNKLLVYNYKNDSWSINQDCITVFGYWEQSTDLTWASTTTTWGESEFTWIDNIEDAMSRQIIAGNMQGYVFIVDSDQNRNAPVMQITNMVYNSTTGLVTITAYDHTLSVNEDSINSYFGNYILIENAQGVSFVSQNTIFSIESIIDPNTITIRTVMTGTYTGGGTITRVSNIGILSKQWNPYSKDGRDVNLSRIEFFVNKTSAGEVTVDYFPSSTDISMLQEGGPAGTNCIVGNNILETSPDPAIPLEALQTRLWKSVYFLGEGNVIQIYISMSDAQITDPAIALAGFQLEAMLLYVRPTTSRIS